MISKRTVLVVGAGGSRAFGFPLGWGLLTSIIGHARSDTYVRYGYTRTATREFADLAESSGCASIDDFLQSRPDHAPLGKIAIADLIARFESHASIFDVGGARQAPSWYDHLLARLSPERRSLGGNRLTVVTFNYDRSFEYYLRTALIARLGIAATQADAEVAKIPVLHVHGDLGSLADRPYAAGVNDIDSIRRSAASIRVAHERGSDGDLPLSSYILGAERVYFIGFGFLASNMRLLIPGEGTPPSAELFASGYGMTDEERRIASHLARRAIQFAPDDLDALDSMRFLRDIST